MLTPGVLKPDVVSVTETVDAGLEPGLASLGLERRSDGLISWASNSKDHPRNWTNARKAFDTTVIISLEFFVLVCVIAQTCLHVPFT
jgi:hypothetical protein